jgi:hypothetical protein
LGSPPAGPVPLSLGELSELGGTLNIFPILISCFKTFCEPTVAVHMQGGIRTRSNPIHHLIIIIVLKLQREGHCEIDRGEQVFAAFCINQKIFVLFNLLSCFQKQIIFKIFDFFKANFASFGIYHLLN